MAYVIDFKLLVSGDELINIHREYIFNKDGTVRDWEFMKRRVYGE